MTDLRGHLLRRRTGLEAGAIALAVTVSPPALAQDTARVRQPSDRVNASQVETGEDRRVDAAQVDASRPVSPTEQLTSERRGTSAGTQLAPAGRSVQASAPLSRPAEGRVVATERLRGHDRCDPARPSAGAARCAQVVENRAADFARPRPTLSPEQRLLVEQRLGERPRSLDTEMRRLVRNEGNPNSSDAQAIAAAALANQGSVASTPTTEDPAATAADTGMVEAIITGGNGTTAPLSPR